MQPQHARQPLASAATQSISCTIHPQTTKLALDGTVLKESPDLFILGVMFDDKINLRSILMLFPVLQLRGFVSSEVLVPPSLIFLMFALPALEYCSGVWCSGADSHLKILD